MTGIIKTWKERKGLMNSEPFRAFIGVEWEMQAEIDELRTALAQQAEPAVEPAEKSILNNSANSAIYAKGHADGRKEAMADIRELLGITNGSLDL